MIDLENAQKVSHEVSGTLEVVSAAANTNGVIIYNFEAINEQANPIRLLIDDVPYFISRASASTYYDRPFMAGDPVRIPAGQSIKIANDAGSNQKAYLWYEVQ